MEYSNYPFDSQKCLVQMGSAAYTDVYMVFSGKVKYRSEDQRAIQYKARKDWSCYLLVKWNEILKCCGYQPFLPLWTLKIKKRSLECQQMRLVNLKKEAKWV
jgi:hypothetical protein